MPATPSRIGFVLEEWRRAVSETADVSEKYGNLARQSEDPLVTYFDEVDDAQVMADARQELLSKDRRMFSVTAKGVDEAMDLVYTAGAIPIAHYVDDERAADRPMLVAEIGFDFDKQQSTFRVWG